jgi:hypothetical protein
MQILGYSLQHECSCGHLNLGWGCAQVGLLEIGVSLSSCFGYDGPSAGLYQPAQH